MKIALVILVVILLALQCRLFFGEDGIYQAYLLKKDIAEQERKNEEVKEYNAILEEEIDSLKRGGDAIESKARNDLGMIKKGEVFYQVVKE